MVRICAFAVVLLMPAMLGSTGNSSIPMQPSIDRVAVVKAPLMRARGAEAASHLSLPGQKKRKPVTLLA